MYYVLENEVYVGITIVLLVLSKRVNMKLFVNKWPTVDYSD